jgi:hypothetical protein
LKDWVGDEFRVVLQDSQLLAAPDDMEMEDLNYYYADYSRYVESFSDLAILDPWHSIYNDVITLRKGSGYM